MDLISLLSAVFFFFFIHRSWRWLAVIALGCDTWTASAVWSVAVDLSLYSHLPNCSSGIEWPVDVLDVRFNQLLNWVQIALGLIASPRWWESRVFCLAELHASNLYISEMPVVRADVDSAPAHISLIDAFIVLPPDPVCFGWEETSR